MSVTLVPAILSRPIEVSGEWHAPSRSAKLVVGRMREACTTGYIIRSDRQPNKIRVENRPSGPPAIWLHKNENDTAVILVDVGERAWIQLAYQFGHEFGHVMCNSWSRDANTSAPCQWIEEMLVESFSLRGLEILAQTWAIKPPFANDSNYAQAIMQYRSNMIKEYEKFAREQGLSSTKSWFYSNKKAIEEFIGLSDYAKAATTVLLPSLMSNPMLLEDLGALNRWPERAALPLNVYLDNWEKSCNSIGAPGELPNIIKKHFCDN